MTKQKEGASDTPEFISALKYIQYLNHIIRHDKAMKQQDNAYAANANTHTVAPEIPTDLQPIDAQQVHPDAEAESDEEEYSDGKQKLADIEQWIADVDAANADGYLAIPELHIDAQYGSAIKGVMG